MKPHWWCCKINGWPETFFLAQNLLDQDVFCQDNETVVFNRFCSNLAWSFLNHVFSESTLSIDFLRIYSGSLPFHNYFVLTKCGTGPRTIKLQTANLWCEKWCNRTQVFNAAMSESKNMKPLEFQQFFSLCLFLLGNVVFPKCTSMHVSCNSLCT